MSLKFLGCPDPAQSTTRLVGKQIKHLNELRGLLFLLFLFCDCLASCVRSGLQLYALERLPDRKHASCSPSKAPVPYTRKLNFADYERPQALEGSVSLVPYQFPRYIKACWVCLLVIWQMPQHWSTQHLLQTIQATLYLHLEHQYHNHINLTKWHVKSAQQ